MLYIPFVAIALVLLLDALPWYTSKKRRRKETASRMWIRVLVFVALIAIVWWGLFTPWVNKDWVTSPTVINPDATGPTALVAYYPGRSTFSAEIATAFADGLATNGWRVEVVAAGSGAPTDMTPYSLVAVGSPTYFWQPAQRALKYIASLDLTGKDGAVFSSGLFSTASAAARLEDAIRAVGGHPISSVQVKTGAGMAGMTNPEDVALEAGAAIPLP